MGNLCLMCLGFSQENVDYLEEWSSSSDRASDSDGSSEGGDNSLTVLELRKVTLTACWNGELGMAEVISHKGRMLHSMGIVINGKIYLSIEETMYLGEKGALLLVDESDQTTEIDTHDLFTKLNTDSSWEIFKVYRRLKFLGYIVGRYGIPWSLSVQSCPMPPKVSIGELKPHFEVYLPNRKFSKRCPGTPSFLVYVARGCMPSRSDIEELERQCNGIPLKIGHVDHGRVSFMSFDKMKLPTLP